MSWARGGNFRTDIMKETLRLGPFEWIHFLQLLGPMLIHEKAPGAVSHRCVCEPPQQGIECCFFKPFEWLPPEKESMEMYGGKLWERPQSFVCVYMYICGCVRVCESRLFPDAVESLCVSGTNWTHTLLDGAADMYPVANLQCTIFPSTEALPGKACPKRSTIASLRLLILPLFSHLVATWWSATVWALLWIDLIS